MWWLDHEPGLHRLCLSAALRRDDEVSSGQDQPVESAIVQQIHAQAHTVGRGGTRHVEPVRAQARREGVGLSLQPPANVIHRSGKSEVAATYGEGDIGWVGGNGETYLEAPSAGDKVLRSAATINAAGLSGTIQDERANAVGRRKAQLQLRAGSDGHGGISRESSLREHQRPRVDGRVPRVGVCASQRKRAVPYFGQSAVGRVVAINW